MATTWPTVISALKSRLEDDLPARITAESQTAITGFLRHRPGVLIEAEAPQVWVAPFQGEPGPHVGFGGANASQGRTLRVLVGVTAAGSDADTVAESAEVYADLIRSVVTANQSYGTGINQVRWVREQFTLDLPAEGALFLEVVHTFDVQVWGSLGDD